MCREKGCLVTTIGKEVNKFISELYVTVMAGKDAAKAKCKAVMNRAFSVMRMTRLNDKILVFVSRFRIHRSVSMKPSLTETIASRKGILLNECEHVNFMVEFKLLSVKIIDK